MQQITNMRKLMSFLLLACILQACHSATVTPANAAGTQSQPLMCYVCDNCAKLTKQTLLVECDADFFGKSSTMQDPTTTTAEPSTTIADSTTTTIITTTTIAPTTTNVSSTITTVDSTVMPTTEGTTTEAVPTPPTIGPTVTVPTPPNVGIVPALLAVTEVTTSSNAESTSTVSNEAPKALPLVAGNYTYHCYSVQKKINGVEQVERGCSRVTTMESVCNHLKVLNNGTELSKCVPCSNNSCNGSSALGVSMAALLFTLIAALLSRQ